MKTLHRSRALVTIQFVTAGALVLTQDHSANDWGWILVRWTGGAIGLWAIATIGLRRFHVMPEVKSNTELVTNGPYRFVRHPMYTALLLFTAGYVFTPFDWWKIAAWLVLLAVLLGKTRIEERQMQEKFPLYPSYASRTHRFFPYW